MSENQKTEIVMINNEAVEVQVLEEEVKAPPRAYALKEKLLLPVSLLLAILFDRLIIAGFSQLFYLSAVFWLCYMAVVYGFYWQKVKSNGVSMFTALCTAALCIWNLLPNGNIIYNYEYTLITFLVIPSVMVAQMQWIAGGYTLKNSEGMTAAWFEGLFIKPFSGLAYWFGAMGSLVSKENKPTAMRVFLGAAAASALLLVIVPLLMGADKVFNHYVSRFFSGISGAGSLVFHIIVVIVMFGLIYSFIWNIGFGESKRYTVPSIWSIDGIIYSIILGSILTLYILFCIIQFTYLFAGAGLPAGMTYSEYAREGFAQTVAVCTINLIIFGTILRFGKNTKMLKPFLSGLLALTCVMLVSGAVRLNLYIGAYGMTWLRLISAWFIIYLAAVILLCGIRLLLKKKLPTFTLCSLMLLIWYVALGYLNPSNFIAWFN